MKEKAAKKIKKPRKLFNKKEKLKKEKVIKDLDGNVIKKEKPKKVKKIEKIKKHISKYKRVYTLIGFGILAIILVFAIYIGIRSIVMSKKYGKYEKIMDNYGFSMLYENEKAKSYQKLTKIDMIKLVIGVTYNIEEVESRGFVSEGKYDGDEWVSLAKAFGIIEKNYITEENYKEIATYKETLIALLNARNKVLEMSLSSKKESNFKNLQSYSVDERKYINDAVENNLIENGKGKLKLDKKMYKGEFNKLLVTYIEKYNTVAPEGETLVLKEESKPTNAEIYPYILYSVDKKTYEYEPIIDAMPDYKTPIETYKYRKSYYPQVEYRTEEYYNAILNVNYNNIDKEQFLNKINEFLRYDYTDEINSYVEYIKENQITIEGSAKVQFPIFYLDGIRYRARVKLAFEIKNANTDKNILLGDMGRQQEVTYKNKKYERYIDAPMGTTLLSKSLLLDMEPIIDILVNNKEASNSNGI